MQFSTAFVSLYISGQTYRSTRKYTRGRFTSLSGQSISFREMMHSEE